MLEPLIILGGAALVIVLATISYRRKAGVASGAGRGAPTSPVIPAVAAILVVIAAILLLYLLKRG
ncbi:MAG: hypothetical protein QOE79_65 [Sphingomonadales bacterium]|jgi:uncharacterized membrane protein YidH (DUF202 family)|nr:hypothetical protein [Sphingomonadales bacterium]